MFSDTLVTTFRQDMAIRGFSDHTIGSYCRYVTDFFKFHPGLTPENVQEEHVRSYLFNLKDNRGLAIATSNIAVASLRHFFHVTQKQDLPITRIPYHKRGYQVPNILNSEELQRLFLALGNLKYQAMFETAYSVGLRSSEVLNLKLENIDSKAHTLTVKQGKGRRDRVVELSPHVLETLRTYWRSCKVKPKTFFFPGAKPGEPMQSTTMHKLFKKAAKLAGIQKRVSMHSLRHSFATHALEQGIPIQEVSRILGHRSIQTTLKYLHFTKIPSREIILPLDRLFNKK